MVHGMLTSCSEKVTSLGLEGHFIILEQGNMSSCTSMCLGSSCWLGVVGDSLALHMSKPKVVRSYDGNRRCRCNESIVVNM
mmetsp:Transcript_89529/g.175225  ORF Transcript_89529/g.175225 Transcript_89529/m.175225 type:complete len:81 (-) Transcript_89529:93-335(-)